MAGHAAQQSRAWVDEGHAAVRAGRYADAGRLFHQALGPLRESLGEGHVEVRTLVEDIATVKAMAEMALFGRSLGMEGGDQDVRRVTWRPGEPPDER